MGERLREVLLDPSQAILAAGELGDCAGELLAREELLALAQRRTRSRRKRNEGAVLTAA